MKLRLRVLAAGALALVEYLLISILFDARDLAPPALDNLGDLAPIPVIAGAAFLILTSSARGHNSAAGPAAGGHGEAKRGVTVLLLGLHALSFGGFVAGSWQLRAMHAAEQPATAMELAWLVLALATALLLVATATAGAFLATVRRFAGPLTLGAAVGVGAWAAGQGTGELWEPLSRATMLPVAAVLRALSPDPVIDHDALIIGTERFNVEIAPVCSGYEGMGLVAVLLGSFLWSYRATLRFPHALVVPVLGVALAFLANAARITALIYVGTLGASDAAFDAFHSKAGWLLFCGVALGTVALARRWPALQRDGGAADGAETSNPTIPYLVPLLAAVSGRLVAGLADDGSLDLLEAIPLGAALLALALLRRGVRASLPSGGALVARPALVAVGVGVLVAALWLPLTTGDRAGDELASATLASWSTTGAALWIALRIVASVLVAPVVEELAFRGFLLRRVVGAGFSELGYRAATPVALVVSSAVFAAVHTNFVGACIAGACYGATVWATGRLRDAVLAHAVTNAIIAVVVLGTGRWSLWV
ncbi:MAG: exosortase E/protease, VPEID-CTERM system [Deltaproteobacteria bacterium]|nr:exosortase E/protease, VPEID-CTERM system [Deltaproteobacteria bacterium]